MMVNKFMGNKFSNDESDQQKLQDLVRQQVEQIQWGVVDLIHPHELERKIKKSLQTGIPLKIKFGADPTRSDLHLGHTVVLNKLRQFQNLGHHIQFVIGDFTALIGDPTGRNETRPTLTPDEIYQNAKTYAEQVHRILDPDKMDLVYNQNWFKELSPSDFIRLSAQYTLARILERDDFSKRFKGNVPISIHELLYPLCQGYDSVHLRSDVELGGTDQKFNLLVGRELQKAYGQEDQQCVITLPLLEGLDGVQKMSKSADNYISVIDSPKEMFGKTMRVSDELMFRWFELLTDISKKEVDQMKEGVQNGELHPKNLKIKLAKFIVSRFHSSAQAQTAEEEFQRIFVQKGLPDEVPEILLPTSESSISIAHFIHRVGLAESVGEARRLIRGGAVELDQQKVRDESLLITLTDGQILLLKVGKKKFARVTVRWAKGTTL